MSFWKALFHPVRLALGAVVFIIIFNPGILFTILAAMWHLISTSWIASAIVTVFVFGFLIDYE